MTIDVDKIGLDEGAEIKRVMRKHYQVLIKTAYDDVATQYDFDIAFDLENEFVQQTLDQLANQITSVADTTKDEIRRLVGKQAEEGWSTDRLADEIRAHGEIASKSRATMIARTESATAYNAGSLLSYKEAGVTKVKVLDGDDDEECNKANGQTWTIEKAMQNLTAHPNCERTFVPIVGEE